MALKVNVSFKHKDLGLKKLKAELAELKKNPGVKIGVLAKDGLQQKKVRDGKKTKAITLVEVATFHEFGGEGNRPPERSFIRSTVAREQEKWKTRIAELFKQIIDGGQEMTVKRALGIIGEMAQNDIKKSFTDPGWPDKPLAPSTIGRRNAKLKTPKAEGSEDNHKPLIDTGQLRNSIRWQRLKDNE